MSDKYGFDEAVAESGFVATGAVESYTDDTGAVVDYDGAGYANFGAKAAASGTVSLKFWTMVAGVRTLAATVAGAIWTFASDVIVPITKKFALNTGKTSSLSELSTGLVALQVGSTGFQLANDAVLNLESVLSKTTAFRGMLMISDDTGSTDILVLGENDADSSHGVGRLDGVAGYSVSKGNASTSNIYYDTGVNNRWELQNKTGATRTYRAIWFPMG